jgi:Tfp pilus assembly protein PilN
MKAVNLLPSDMRGAGKPVSAVVASGDEATGRVGAFALLGVLAFCVVALAAYVLVNNTVKDRRAQLDQVTAQANTLTAQANKLKPYADFAAKAQERVQTVKDLAAARFDWEQALRDISRVVPAGVTLSQLDASIGSDAGSGSGLRSAIAAPAVELNGCTTGGQVAVAKLMSRLRDVDGVTRVTLTKSDKPDTAVASSATSGSAPEGCGPGRAPVFDVVVFFERSQVPATLDQVSAPTSSSASSQTTSASSSTAAPSATPAATSTPTTTP